MAGSPEPLIVEVRNRFDGSWSHGFAIVEHTISAEGEPRIRLRRLSDGHILPELFSADDVLLNPAGTPTWLPRLHGRD
jgi:hypothetical protein